MNAEPHYPRGGWKIEVAADVSTRGMGSRSLGPWGIVNVSSARTAMAARSTL